MFPADHPAARKTIIGRTIWNGKLGSVRYAALLTVYSLGSGHSGCSNSNTTEGEQSVLALPID
jgi:hypothetical protein